jgi:cardiolipin synthase A/B
LKTRLSKATFISIIGLVVGLSLLVGAQNAPNGQLQGRQQLIATPNPAGHPEFLAAIQSAKQSILMTMYHLTDQAIVNALVQARARNIEVRIILDGDGLKDKRRQAFAAQLSTGSVSVLPSSPAFTLTHEKAMVIDRSYAFVTAINLTDNAATTRDLGIILNDPGVIKEMLAVFETDWANAQNKTGLTPPLSNPNLVWSPVNSGPKLSSLINSAKATIVSTVENLGEPSIMNAYANAAARGVNVRLIVPMCDKNSNPAFNYKFIPDLVARGVHVKVMPAPETKDQPYMHSKMILVDNTYAYVGSVNFSFNSVMKARELGIIFGVPQLAAQIGSIFEIDWGHAVVAGAPPTNCPAVAL